MREDKEFLYVYIHIKYVHVYIHYTQSCDYLMTLSKKVANIYYRNTVIGFVYK